MNVLHVATLNRPISKNLGYGPIETVVYNLDKGLHELGCRSIVACSGDSKVIGEHFPTIEHSFSEYCTDHTLVKQKLMRQHLVMSLQRAQRGDIDVMHLHDADMMEYMFSGVCLSPIPIVMTLHVPADDHRGFTRWNDTLLPTSPAFFVPISEFQQAQHQGIINGQNVIHHGVDVDEFPFTTHPSTHDYLFSIGRITPDKGQDQAIDVARRSGSRLILAGNVQNKAKDREFFTSLQHSIDLVVDAGQPCAAGDYYEQVMKPILDSDKQIIYIGEVDSHQKKLWYQHAQATLFPIQWGEPFGLVLIESMACGTPVIAFNKGSVSEILVHGKTGFIVDSLERMTEAVKALQLIDPRDCRQHVEDHFSIANMASKYSDLYQQIVDERTICPKTSPSVTGPS